VSNALAEGVAGGNDNREGEGDALLVAPAPCSRCNRAGTSILCVAWTKALEGGVGISRLCTEGGVAEGGSISIDIDDSSSRLAMALEPKVKVDDDLL